MTDLTPHPTLSPPYGEPDYDHSCADCREGRHGRLARTQPAESALRKALATGLCSEFMAHGHDAFLQPDHCEDGLTDADALLPYIRDALDTPAPPLDVEVCSAYTATLEHDIDRLSVWAARYALGRMTYAVADTVDVLVRNASVLTEQSRQVIARDIEEQRERGGLGMEMDAREWDHLARILRDRQPAADAGGPESA